MPAHLIGKGLIAVSPALATHNPKVFAGGDAVDQPRSIVTAIAAGKKAAISIDLYLKGAAPEGMLSRIMVGNKGSLSFAAYVSGGRFEMNQEPRNVVAFDQLNTLFFEHSNRVGTRTLSPQAALQGFREVNLGFTREEATTSALRCFSCGQCNYCYNCYYFCPEGAVTLDPVTRQRYVDYEHCKGCGTCAQSCPRSGVVMKELG
jgi:Pyruvate/2-oxoacid:ferredoxin oxidoreductase delta subunit